VKQSNPDLYKLWKNKYERDSGLKCLMKPIFNQNTVALYFHNLKPDNYVFINNTWYKLQKNNRWRESQLGMINDIADTIMTEFNKLSEYYLKILNETNSNIFNPNTTEADKKLLTTKKSKTESKLKIIVKRCNEVGSVMFRESCLRDLRDLYHNEDIKFNHNPYLLGFKTKVYDMKEGKMRDYEPKDYISISTGYDLVEQSEE